MCVGRYSLPIIEHITNPPNTTSATTMATEVDPPQTYETHHINGQSNMESSEPPPLKVKSTGLESEVHLLRQKNEDLQVELEKLRQQYNNYSAQHVKQVNGDAKPIHNQSPLRPGEPNDDKFNDEDNATGHNTLSLSKCGSHESKASSLIHPPLTPQRVRSPMVEFTTPTQSNRKKLAKDDKGNYTSASAFDIEGAPILPDENTDDGSNSDDSSHNKHINSRRSNLQAHQSQAFWHDIKERGGWLIGLLFLQSCSSFIIQYNEQFLQNHMVIVQFLTMLVGAGGNAGNQASVRVIRGLALGTLNSRTQRHFLKEEVKMALGLSAMLGLTGFIRAMLFKTPLGETVAVTTSLCAIVLISVGIGNLLPLGMKKCGIDPAHSSTTIQVVMDIMGVLITICVSSFVLSFSVFQHEAGKEISDETVT